MGPILPPFAFNSQKGKCSPKTNMHCFCVFLIFNLFENQERNRLLGYFEAQFGSFCTNFKEIRIFFKYRPATIFQTLTWKTVPDFRKYCYFWKRHLPAVHVRSTYHAIFIKFTTGQSRQAGFQAAFKLRDVLEYPTNLVFSYRIIIHYIEITNFQRKYTLST